MKCYFDYNLFPAKTEFLVHLIPLKTNLKAHIALLLANLIYGANYTIAKEVMPSFIEPVGFILLRVIGALFMFSLTTLIWRKFSSIDRRDVPRLVFCGLTGVAANQVFFFKGLSLTTPINAGIMMIITPILVLLLSSFILGESLTFKKITGILLGIAGAFTLIISKYGIGAMGEAGIGDLFIFFNALSYGLYLVSVKPLMKKYDTIMLLNYLFAIGFIFVLPFGWEEFNRIDWTSFPPNIWWSVLFVVAGTTYFAYLFNNYGLKTISPGVVSVYIYLQPFLAAVIALMLGKDELDAIKIISGLLIFMGVYLVSSTEMKNVKI